jgi:hypothetical protein
MLLYCDVPWARGTCLQLGDNGASQLPVWEPAPNVKIWLALSLSPLFPLYWFNRAPLLLCVFFRYPVPRASLISPGMPQNNFAPPPPIQSCLPAVCVLFCAQFCMGGKLGLSHESGDFRNFVQWGGGGVPLSTTKMPPASHFSQRGVCKEQCFNFKRTHFGVLWRRMCNEVISR